MLKGSLLVGESLVGDGNEVAHIDLMIGPKDGPVGAAFAQRLALQTSGHNALLALLAPNVPAKPDTVMFNKVTIKGADQAVHMFGPAQAAVGKAVVDSVADGTIPRSDADNLAIIVGVFIHWDASDKKKIYDFNYRATREAIARAVNGQPTADEVVKQKDSAKHPFA
jgi:5,6,7,8-tetrahydromethanopterin hydro-lyase